MSNNGFKTINKNNNILIDETIETTTYLLARDEDCENTFHSTADFMNIYFVMSLLNINPNNQQIMLWDKFSTGPYEELIKNAFSSNFPILRHTHYKNKKILFKHIIWHLESPAGLIFPRVANPDPMRCHNTALFKSYRKYILQSFNLYNQLPSQIPIITLSLRHRTPAKNVGRVMMNEIEVIKVLQEGNMITYQVVDFSKMTFTEQLKTIRSTNILIGIHGVY